MAFVAPDWAGLWRELVERSAARQGSFEQTCRSERYLRRLRAEPPAEGVPDPLVDFVVHRLTPASTVLDIGAGAGRWTLRLAPFVRALTAIEPLAELRDLLEQRAAAARVRNIEIVAGTFEPSDVALHDVVINSHAMYGSADLPGLVQSMEGRARRACCMVMRRVAVDGVMAVLSRALWGHPHDSPNFTIGYNVLLDMGIAADVVVDPVVKRWQDSSLETACERARRHLHLAPDDHRHDELVRDVLGRRLLARDGSWHWPDGVQSALAWWPVRERSAQGEQG